MSHTHMKALRSVKRASLLFVQTFVESASSDASAGRSNVPHAKSEDTSNAVRRQIVQFIMPPLLESVLPDYRYD